MYRPPSLHGMRRTPHHIPTFTPGRSSRQVLLLSCARRGHHYVEECIEEACEAVEWCRRAAAGKAISVLGHDVGATVALQVALKCKRQDPCPPPIHISHRRSRSPALVWKVKGVAALSLPPQSLPSPMELKKLKAEVPHPAL